MSTLLFDIGGTHMRMAVGEVVAGEAATARVLGEVSGNGAIHEFRKIHTPRAPRAALDELAAYAKEFIPHPDRICGGIAAVVEGGVLRTAAHLPEWNGFDLGGELGKMFGVPVVPTEIHNDAEMAALGEAQYGAGKGHDLVAYIGIGTGVGGALIENGRIAPHAEGFEPGHQILDVEHGTTFEEFVSGTALAKRFGKPSNELTHDVFKEVTPQLAAGLYNVILTWSPDILVLGGSLMNEKNGFHIDEVTEALAALPRALPEFPPIVHAALGDESGLYGALAISVKESTT